jgi:2-dehydropantoate 2-reductase
VSKDIDGPIFRRIAEIIHDIEDGRRTCEVANLDELASYAAELQGRTTDADKA